MLTRKALPLTLARSVHFWAALCALLLASFSLASAAETYDLAKLLVREPQVGEIVREASSESETGRQVIRREGKVVQDQASSKRQEYARAVEVLSVDAEGNATKTRYTYESYERAQGESKQVLEVEGLKVLVDQTKSPPRIGPEGKRELPPFLENKLRDEVSQPKLEARLEKLKSFLPKAAVEIGATWTREPLQVAKALGLGHEGLNSKASRVKGSLSAGEAEGTLQLKIVIQLTYTTYQGLPCKEPMQVEVVIQATVSSAGDDPAGTMSQELVMGGVVETRGMLVAIDLVQSSKTEITRAK